VWRWELSRREDENNPGARWAWVPSGPILTGNSFLIADTLVEAAPKLLAPVPGDIVITDVIQRDVTYCKAQKQHWYHRKQSHASLSIDRGIRDSTDISLQVPILPCSHSQTLSRTPCICRNPNTEWGPLCKAKRTKVPSLALGVQFWCPAWQGVAHGMKHLLGHKLRCSLQHNADENASALYFSFCFNIFKQ
jgi:hypothetical protein